MFSRVKLTILMLSTLIVAYGLIGGILDKVSARDDAYSDLSIFTEVLNKVRKDYVEKPDLERAVLGAIHGMMEALDPYSSFVTASDYAGLGTRESSAGSTGIVLSKRYGYAYVVAVVPGSPAEEQGIRSGDLIESLDETVTTEMSLWQAQNLMKGEPGSRLQLRLVRARRTGLSEVTLIRRPLSMPELTGRLVEDGIALLKIPHFETGVSEAVAARLKMLRATGMKGLLIDIRENAVGQLEEAVLTADLFLNKGSRVLTVKDRQGSETVYASLSDPGVAGLPVILLIDAGTSGSAEVFAAALRDNNLAELVGERTDGRGSLQDRFLLDDGSALFISTRLFYRPSGEPVQKKELRESGIQPDTRSPGQDFVTRFYFDNAGVDVDENLGDDFYRKLDQAIEQEQMDTGIEQIRSLIGQKAA